LKTEGSRGKEKKEKKQDSILVSRMIFKGGSRWGRHVRESGASVRRGKIVERGKRPDPERCPTTTTTEEG